jgi:DNA polymerase III alpha subunit
MVRKATKPRENQPSLFSIEQAPLVLDSCEEWPENVRLSREFDILGTFVSAHPVDAYREKHIAKLTHRPGDYHGMVEFKGRICVLGIVMASVPPTPTRRVGFVTVSDPCGSAEYLVFSDDWDRYCFAMRKWDISAFSLAVRHSPNRAPALQVKSAARLGTFEFSRK